MTEILYNMPDNPEAFQRCKLELGCAASQRCIVKPIREGAKMMALDISLEQSMADLHTIADSSDDRNEEELVHNLENQADLLEKLKKNLALCGIVQLREEIYPQTS